jgi:hypothetical protein
LDGWQNQTIFALMFLTALWLAAKRGCSFVEVFSWRLDSIFVGVLQKWHNRIWKPAGRPFQ